MVIIRISQDAGSILRYSDVDQIGVVRTKPVHKFNYLGRFLTGDGKCNNDNRRGIEIRKICLLSVSQRLL